MLLRLAGVPRSLPPSPCCGAGFLDVLLLLWFVEYSFRFNFLSHAACAFLYTSLRGFPFEAGALEPRASQRPKRTESINPNPLRQRSTRCHFRQLAMKIRTVDISTPFQLPAVTGGLHGLLQPLLNSVLRSTFAIKTAMHKGSNWTNVSAIPSHHCLSRLLFRLQAHQAFPPARGLTPRCCQYHRLIVSVPHLC